MFRVEAVQRKPDLLYRIAYSEAIVEDPILERLGRTDLGTSVHPSHPISFAHESHNLRPFLNRVVGFGSLRAGSLRYQLSQLHLMQILSNRSCCASVIAGGEGRRSSLKLAISAEAMRLVTIPLQHRSHMVSPSGPGRIMPILRFARSSSVITGRKPQSQQNFTSV